MKFSFLTTIYVFVSWISYAQSIQDTVFIREVGIKGAKINIDAENVYKSTVIDTIILQSSFNKTLANLLHNQTSIFIKNEGRGGLSSISMRGTASTHTEINWNGLSLNSPMTGMSDLSLVPIYVIDDIRITNGDASLEETEGAMGGVIRLSNKPKWQKGVDYIASVGFGSYDTNNNFIKLNCGYKRLQMVTRIYSNKSENDYSYLNKKNGKIDFDTGLIIHEKVKNNNANYLLNGLMQEVYLKVNENNIVNFSLWHQLSNRSLPEVTSNESNSHTNVNNLHQIDSKVFATWKHYDHNQKIYVSGALSKQDMRYNYKKNVVGKGLTSIIDANNDYKLFLASCHYIRDTGDKIKYSAKCDIKYSDVDSREYIYQTGYKQSQLLINLKSICNYNMIDRLTTRLLLNNKLLDNELTFTAYLGLNYQLLKSHKLFVKANVAMNHRTPSLNDMFFLPGGNPDLNAEKSRGGEISIVYNDFNFNGEMTYYKKNIYDWIQWMYSGIGYWSPVNIKKVQTNGVECNLKHSNNLGQLNYKMIVSYAYTESLNYGNKKEIAKSVYGKQMIYIPLHNASLDVNFSYKNYSCSYNWCHYSERFTTSTNDINKRDWLYPYYMSNLSLSYKNKIKKTNFKIDIQVYNLLNESYRTILGQQMPERNYMFTISINN